MKKQTANSHPGVSRRMFLEGLGASIPLPFLASVASPSRAKAAACTPTPKRFVAWFTPNGYMKQHIVPSGTGANYDLKGTLAPLGTLGIQSNVSVLSNLHRRDAAFSGNGAHGFMTPAFLTCVKLNPSAVTAGTRSADQVAADTLACDSNKVASLRIGLNSVFGGGRNTIPSSAKPSPTRPPRCCRIGIRRLCSTTFSRARTPWRRTTPRASDAQNN